jgi:hypothetical protein
VTRTEARQRSGRGAARPPLDLIHRSNCSTPGADGVFAPPRNAETWTQSSPEGVTGTPVSEASPAQRGGAIPDDSQCLQCPECGWSGTMAETADDGPSAPIVCPLCGSAGLVPEGEGDAKSTP